jgi:hypothetical protein
MKRSGFRRRQWTNLLYESGYTCRPRRWENRGSIHGGEGGRYFSFRHCVWNRSGAHPPSFLWDKATGVTLTSSLHLVTLVKKEWNGISVSRTSSLRGASLSTGKSLPVCTEKRFMGISRLCGIWGSHSGGYEEYIFWDITPCSPLRINRRFGGTYRLHLRGRKISWARNHAGLHGVMSQKMVRFIKWLFFCCYVQRDSIISACCVVLCW